MPLVFFEAWKRRSMIRNDALLDQLEIHGFAKCVARKSCMCEAPIPQYVTVLTDSLTKQFADFSKAERSIDQLEALADLRNVAGLLFLALKELALKKRDA